MFHNCLTTTYDKLDEEVKRLREGFLGKATLLKQQELPCGFGYMLFQFTNERGAVTGYTMLSIAPVRNH